MQWSTCQYGLQIGLQTGIEFCFLPFQYGLEIKGRQLAWNLFSYVETAKKILGCSSKMCNEAGKGIWSMNY